MATSRSSNLGEIQIKHPSGDFADAPSVTGLSDGGWIVVWKATVNEADERIAGQRYNSWGQQIGAVFEIDTYYNGTGNGYGPSVTALPDGGWAVIWDSPGDYESFEAMYPIAGSRGTFVRLYSPSTEGDMVAGDMVAGNALLLDEEPMAQTPDITTLTDGKLVVTRERNTSNNADIVWDLLGSSGVLIGGESPRVVNTYTSNSQSESSVAALSDGGWVVTWQSSGQDGSGAGVYGQRYLSTGSRSGNEFLVNTTTTGDQSYPHVAALSDGGWVVTWSDFDSEHVMGRLYASSGDPIGSEFRVTRTQTDSDLFLDVAALSDGGWVVTWFSYNDSNIYWRRYASNGDPIGDEFLVNTTTQQYLFHPSVTALSDGGWVVTWYSGAFVYSQRYDANGTAYTDGERVEGDVTDQTIEGTDGSDILIGGDGDDTLNGGAGIDTVVYLNNASEYTLIRSNDGSVLVQHSVADRDGIDQLIDVEYVVFDKTRIDLRSYFNVTNDLSNVQSIALAPDDKSLVIRIGDVSHTVSRGSVLTFAGSSGTLDPVQIEQTQALDYFKSIEGNVSHSSKVVSSVFSTIVNGTSEYILPVRFTGPVELGLNYQLIDDTENAVIVGSSSNDFIKSSNGNSLGKAIDAGSGSDVIDGGVGSAFLTGGAGSDTFFLDGRGGNVSWSTITDFEFGSDKATIWGWRQGVSRVVSVNESGGAAGYEGVTFHFENLLPSDASVGATNSNLNSLTFTDTTLNDFLGSGTTVEQLIDHLNGLTIGGSSSSRFSIGETVDGLGTHGYLHLG